MKKALNEAIEAANRFAEKVEEARNKFDLGKFRERKDADKVLSLLMNVEISALKDEKRLVDARNIIEDNEF